MNNIRLSQYLTKKKKTIHLEEANLSDSNYHYYCYPGCNAKELLYALEKGLHIYVKAPGKNKYIFCYPSEMFKLSPFQRTYLLQEGATVV